MGASRIYRIGVPFNAVDLAELDHEQSADVIYFAHWDYQQSRLQRFGHTDWRFGYVAFGPTQAAPTSVGAVATVVNDGDGPLGGPGNSYPTAAVYFVSAINDNTGQESRSSSPGASVSNDLTLKGNRNTISWTAATDATRYAVYKVETGIGTLPGYIGTTEGVSFIDDNISPDYSDTPPQARNPLSGVNNYPSTVTFFEQRLVWARSKSKPNGIWGSRASDFENMDTSRPARDDDAVTFGISSGRLNAVNHLVSMGDLLALTSDSLFKITGSNQTGYLTPSPVVRRSIGTGAQRLKPLILDTVVLYKPAIGSRVETIGYSFEIDGYDSSDVAIFSPHFFRGFTITSWAFAREPLSCVWAARSDGKLLCFTWERAQQVWGWTLCETDGFVESVCAITEEGEDRVYLAVRRIVQGESRTFIERMASPLWEDINDACYLDCAISQTFTTPQSEVLELSHLEGREVRVVADGNVVSGLVVAAGKVTLPYTASRVTVGLAYSARIETLPLALSMQGTSVSKKQAIKSAALMVTRTRGLRVGTRDTELYDIKPRTDEAYGEANALLNTIIDIDLPPRWSRSATIIIEQTQPLPFTITAILLDPMVTE